jgi:hypothetical protein
MNSVSFSTLHADFDELFELLLDFEQKERKLSAAEVRPTANAVRSFLQSEMALVAAPPAGGPAFDLNH